MLCRRRIGAGPVAIFLAREKPVRTREVGKVGRKSGINQPRVGSGAAALGLRIDRGGGATVARA